MKRKSPPKAKGAGKSHPRRARKRNRPARRFAGLAWVSKEYPEHKRTIGWFAGIVALFSALVGLAIFLGMFALSLILVLALIAIFRLSFEKPQSIRWRLESEGIFKNDELVPWNSVTTFWQNPKSEKRGSVFLQLTNGDIIPIHYQKVSGQKLRTRLRQFVPERLQTHTDTGEILNHLLKF